MAYRRRRVRKVRPYRRHTTGRWPTMRLKRNVGKSAYQVILKDTGIIASDGAGNIQFDFRPSQVAATPLDDYLSCTTMYNQYSVKAISVRLFAINVGEESAPPPANFRGRLGTFMDYDGAGVSTTLGGAVQYNSFRMVPARAGKIGRYMKISRSQRPKLNQTQGGALFDAQNSDSALRVIGENFTPATDQYWYVARYYCTFYSRR